MKLQVVSQEVKVVVVHFNNMSVVQTMGILTKINTLKE
jgi:hypothetical protein